MSVTSRILPLPINERLALSLNGIIDEALWAMPFPDDADERYTFSLGLIAGLAREALKSVKEDRTLRLTGDLKVIHLDKKMFDALVKVKTIEVNRVRLVLVEE